MKAEINKEIELVQILLYLSEQQDKTIQCINNKTYTAAISEWFAPYKNHPAVQLTKDLICNENFIHIRPLQAILSLKEITATPDWNFDFFAKGIAHEYAHCFVNPVVEAHVDLLQKYPDFFAKHKDVPNFYNTDYAVINEYFVRAFQIRFMECNKALFPGFDIEKEYEYQRKAFLFIDKFVDVLREFEASDMIFSEFYLARIEGLLAAILETTAH